MLVIRHACTHNIFGHITSDFTIKSLNTTSILWPLNCVLLRSDDVLNWKECANVPWATVDLSFVAKSNYQVEEYSYSGSLVT